ncbi:MAG: flagellar protein FlaG [Bryobacteraceae bacterium]|jgi:hypothetical protein
MDLAIVSNPGQALPAAYETVSPRWLAENRGMISSIASMDAVELFGAGSELTFALDRDTKQPVVRVVNQHTGEILWQTPPEYMLQLAQTFGQPSG